MPPSCVTLIGTPGRRKVSTSTKLQWPNISTRHHLLEMISPFDTAMHLERALNIRRADAKNDASARQIELNSDATEAAKRLIMRADLLGADKPTHYLLPKNLSRIAWGKHKGERRYDPNQHQEYWDSAWHSLTEKAGFPGLRFHDLRHSFVTDMVERGVPWGTIEAQVGHVSAKMLRHYTHISCGSAQSRCAAGCRSHP